MLLYWRGKKVCKVYHKLTLHEVPFIHFAHGHTYVNSGYDIHFPEMPRRLELVFFEKGDVVQQWEDGTERSIPEGSFCLFTFEKPFRMYSREPMCRHITVGFETVYTRQVITPEEMLVFDREAGWSAAVLYADEPLMPDSNNPLEGLLSRLTAAFSLPSASQGARCVSLLFDMLAVLTEETCRRVLLEQGTLSPSGLRYARHAVRYVADHLSEPIRVADVAASLGIGVSYLSNLFKSYTGKNLIRFINEMKVERLKSLLTTQRLTLREAAESVGLADENYAGRLFKRYTGQSVREFQRLNHHGADKDRW